MEEITDFTMQDIRGGLPLDGDSLKRKREETKKEAKTGEQYPVEGEPVVAKPRLENSEPVENERTDSCGEAGQNADPMIGGEGVGENPEKIESKVDAGDQDRVTADSKEKEEQVNAQGGEEDVKIDKEMDREISQDSGKMTEKKESEENGQVDAPGNDEEDKCKQSIDETVKEKPNEVEGFEEKKISETCGEPMEVEGFAEKEGSGKSGEPMEVEDSKEGGDLERNVETEKKGKENVEEPWNTEADDLRQAAGSQEELVSRNNLEVEQDAKEENTGESCKPQADVIMQADAAKEDEEVPEVQVEVEESRKEDKTHTDNTQGEDLLKEFPGNKVELEQSRKEETEKSLEMETEKLRQSEDSEFPVENIKTDNNSTQEDIEDLSKAEGDKLTQPEGSQEEEIPDSKVETEKSKGWNTGEARKTEIDELTQTDGSQEVSRKEVQVEKSTKENVEEHFKTEIKKLPRVEDSREEVQEATVDADKSTKEDTVESGMTEAAEPTGAEGAEEKDPGEGQAGNGTITTEDTGESSVEEALKLMGAQGLDEKGTGEEKAGNETSSVPIEKLPLIEVHKLAESGGWASLEKHAESREEPLVAEDSVEETNVECESKVGTSTEEDTHQSSAKLHAEGTVKVEESQNESHNTEEPMEVELFSEKEEANERSINIQKGKEDVITSPMELEHVREKDEDPDRVAIVHKDTDDFILGPTEVEHSREKEDGTEGVANAQKYTEDAIAGPMDLGDSSGKADDAKEVKKFEKGTEDATAGPMEVDRSREKEATKETTEVEKGTEDVNASPLEAEQIKEVQHQKKVGQEPKEEAALKKSTEDVTVGPDKEAHSKTQFATDAQQKHEVKSGEAKGEEEALDSQKEETEEIEATNESSDEKSETGTDRDAMSSPTPTRKKRGRRNVAAKAAERQKPPRNPERVELLKKMETLEEMKGLLAEHGRSEKDYKVGDIVEVDDLMQTDYEYKLEAQIGKDFAEGFTPRFTPKEMLELGIFEGKVINDCIFEFPKEWYEGAVETEKLCPQGPDDSVNHFKVKSSLPSKESRKKGRLPRKDPHGWFQWYCRYYLGRRLEPDDSHQMSRWRQMRRQAGQIKKYCEPGDLSCRAKQRQTLLNWSHDCFM